MGAMRELAGGSVLLIISIVMMINIAVLSCKTPQYLSDEQEITSQLHGGIRDREFVFLMVPHKNWSEELEIYEFVVCKLKPKPRVHPAHHYISSSKMPHSPRSHMAAFQEIGPTQQLIQALVAEGNPYPLNYVDALIEADLVVAPTTCVPAYRGIHGQPMALVSHTVDDQRINMAVADLSVQKQRIARENKTHFIGAFGIGAAFSSFGQHELEALRRLIPKKFHQISLPLGGMRKIPYIGGLFRFNWGNPGMTNLGLGMFAVGQNRPFEVFTETALDFKSYKVLTTLPGQNRTTSDNLLEAAALAGTGVGGFVTGRMVISRAASFVAKKGQTMGGQYGVVAAGLLTPLMATFVINSSTNEGKEALDHFQQILTTMSPPTTQAGDLSVVLSQEVRSYLPKVVHLLGRTFFFARWASPIDLFSSCIPSDHADGYTCKPLFELDKSQINQSDHKDTDMDKDKEIQKHITNNHPSPIKPNNPAEQHPAQAYLGQKASPPSSSPLPSTLTFKNCLRYDSISEYPVDRGLKVWQAFMNCRFYGGGSSCDTKYQCRIIFEDKSSCVSRAAQLNEARQKLGSGTFTESQIDYNCELASWR